MLSDFCAEDIFSVKSAESPECGIFFLFWRSTGVVVVVGWDHLVGDRGGPLDSAMETAAHSRHQEKQDSETKTLFQICLSHFVSSDRSSYNDSMLLYMDIWQLFEIFWQYIWFFFLRIDPDDPVAVAVAVVLLLSKRTFRVSPVIFYL